jgi:hypothetical protein
MADVESASILQAPAGAETPLQRRINMAFASALIVIMISLWVYFR